MKTTKENILFIDRWLRFVGIEYIDIRYELIDHLVTEFEQSKKSTNLKDFVQKRLDWCKVTAKKKEKTMHWGIQKSMWKRFLSISTNFKFVLPVVLYVSLLLVVPELFSEKMMRILLVAPVLITIATFLYLLIVKGFAWEKQERVLSIRKLTSLFALPQIFLTLFIFPETWRLNIYFLALGVVIMTLINMASILEYNERRNTILKEYEFLKKELV